MVKDDVERLKDFLNKKSLNIPDFINGMDINHRDIFNDMFFLTNEIISELVSDKVLSEGVISYIVYNYKHSFDEIVKIDKKLFFPISNYYIELFIQLQDYCLKNELYESLTNIKKFDEILFDLEN
jgi:hypothetical protein